MACDSESYGTGDLVPPVVVSPTKDETKPRRNLTQAFEALCVDTSESTADETTTIEECMYRSSPLSVNHPKHDEPAQQQAQAQATAATSKPSSQPFFSPTSVTQPLDSSNNSNSKQTPATVSSAGTVDSDSLAAASSTPPSTLKPYEFNLHPELARDLSPNLISRVSLYAIIHDINKEAAAMAANDPKDDSHHKEELSSPLVKAVSGSEESESTVHVKNAMIDEETWLLDAMARRRDERPSSAASCPATFLQAMGEKEYENPGHAISGGSRTQLWKPSRSWWEAKSGKNPWIEPNSHNKRWRYLWPFIHYHKFLAKCIKKLKRNGVDVKQSVSPVAVFLREEVCAVSDHLAGVSLFGSSEWMDCLSHFAGWTSEASEDVLLAHVRQLKLRPLSEPGDVDSPLLRSQIDQHFLKAMAAQREQLREIPTTIEAPKKAKGHPPMYPRSTNSAAIAAAAAAVAPPSQQQHNYSGGLRRPRHSVAHYHPHGPHYWANPPPPGYDPSTHYGDNSSVQSGISTESGFAAAHHHNPYADPYHPSMAASHHYPSPYYSVPPPMYPGSHPHHQHHNPYAMDPHHHEMYNPAAMGPESPHSFPQQQQQSGGWMDPALASYGVQQSYYEEAPLPPPASPSLEHRTMTDKEEKEDYTNEVTPFHLKNSPQHSPKAGGPPGNSPFWSHLVDGAAQSLATPAKAPSTPNRSTPFHPNSLDHTFAEGEDRMSAQPLLLRGYPYGHYGARDGYAPPSPATQFMMPPTNQSNTFYYGSYPTPGSHSPHRRRSGNLSLRRSPPKASTTNNNDSQPPTPVRKVVEMVDEAVEASPSPSTVETSALSESNAAATTTTTEATAAN